MSFCHHGGGCQHKQGAGARHHIDARRHHGGRVDEGGDRSGALHGVGQPDIERNLRALADGADEEEQCGRRDHPSADFEVVCTLEDLRELHATEGEENRQQAEEKAEVADAVDDEGLLARVTRRLLGDVVADQQVRAEPDPLPADEHHCVGVAQHQHQHEGGEQIHVGEEAEVALVAMHVAGSVNVDQEADTCDHENHHRGEWIEQKAKLDVEHCRVAGHRVGTELHQPTRDPVEQNDFVMAEIRR